jgi:hypothetical protein
VPDWRICRAYDAPAHPALARDASGRAVRLLPTSTPDLEHQAALARVLAQVKPVYEYLGHAEPAAYPERVGALLGAPVRLTAHGPRATDVRELGLL